MATDAAVLIEEIVLPTADLERARLAAAPVVILPISHTDDGRGVYGEATVFLAKELRAVGVDVDYLDAAEGRLFEVKKSVIAAAAITVALGLVSSGLWAAIAALFRSRPDVDDSTMEITYADLRPDGTGRTWRVRGRGAEVLDALDKLTARSDDPDQ